MISVASEGKRFGAVPVLGSVQFTLAAGEVLAIVGPSGIGKTTLLQILAGLDTDFEGRIDVPARRAMVFQEPALLPWRTVLASLTLVTGIGEDRARAALGEMGLGGLEERVPGQLSPGQQRRLALARALAAEPGLLVMDEPFVSLDPALVEEMVDLTARLLRGCSVATGFDTHSPREPQRLANRTVRVTGSPAALEEVAHGP